jgi:hypothetical protein
MKRLHGTLAICALLGAGMAVVDAGETKTGFVNKTFNDNGQDVKYVVFVPKDYDGQRTFPVILFLHGSGETGTDGRSKRPAASRRPSATKSSNSRSSRSFPNRKRAAGGQAAPKASARWPFLTRSKTPTRPTSIAST